MENQNAPWKKGAFFVCEKCGRRDDGDPNLKGIAEDWKKDFKGRLRDEGRGKDARVMVSGCLGICPPNRQVAAWMPLKGETEMLVCDAGDKEDVFRWLKSKL